MSKYVLPAEKITQALEQWLLVAMNDHRAALKAIGERDEEQHKAVLMVGHSYTFAIKAAHDALFCEDPIDPIIAATLDTPEKRVIYYAKRLLENSDAKPESTQIELPHIYQ